MLHTMLVLSLLAKIRRGRPLWPSVANWWLSVVFHSVVLMVHLPLFEVVSVYLYERQLDQQNQENQQDRTPVDIRAHGRRGLDILRA